MKVLSSPRHKSPIIEPSHVPESQAKEYAIYPLTAFDYQDRHENVLKGWIVKGQIDTSLIRSAMDRLVAKWPMLAGRVEQAAKSAGKNKHSRYQLRIPLGLLPAGYEAYGLTAETSQVPLKHHIYSIPAPVLSKLPSPRLFTSQRCLDMGGLHTYIRNDTPLMHWHITHFPAASGDRENVYKGSGTVASGYTAIGLLWNHGVFDGIGAGLILDAFHAELTGNDWKPPAPLSPGLNENPFQTFLDQIEAEEQRVVQATGVASPGSTYDNTVFLNVPYTLRYLWRCAREIVFRGSVGWNISIPERMYTALVASVRSKLASEGVDDVVVSTGDVIVAWLGQTLLSDGRPRSHKIDLGNVVSLRSDWDGLFSIYVNNCNTWLPYPSFTVDEILSTSLHELALKLARIKHGSKNTRKAELVQGYKTLKHSMNHCGLITSTKNKSDGWILVSNMSISNMSRLDWSPAIKDLENGDEERAGKVLYHCQYSVGTPLPVHDYPSIQGKLPNGDLVISCDLSKNKAQRVKEEIEKVLASFK